MHDLSTRVWTVGVRSGLETIVNAIFRRSRRGGRRTQRFGFSSGWCSQKHTRTRPGPRRRGTRVGLCASSTCGREYRERRRDRHGANIRSKTLALLSICKKRRAWGRRDGVWALPLNQLITAENRRDAQGKKSVVAGGRRAGSCRHEMGFVKEAKPIVERRRQGVPRQSCLCRRLRRGFAEEMESGN